MTTINAKIAIGGAAVCFLVAGCATQQDVARLHEYRPQQVCIVKDDKVFDEVLETIRTGFKEHGIATRVVSGTYEKKYATWHPTYSRSDVAGCDALLFYVANWGWDLAYYMYFANIWMTDGQATKKIAQATYDASHNVGVGKFIVAKDKIRELVDQMLASVPSMTKNAVATAPAATPHSTFATPTSAQTADLAAKLQQLDELHKRGLVSDGEYAAKRREILNRL